MIGMFKYLKPYKFKVFIIFILVTLTAFGTLLLPNYMSRIIGEGLDANFQELVGGEWVNVERCDIEANPAICQVEQTSDFDVIIHYGSIMLGVTFVSTLSFIALMYLSSDVSSKVGEDIRSAYYKKINSLSLYETGLHGTSTLITRATNDVMQVQNFIIMALRMVLRIPIIFIGALIFSLQKDVTLTLVILTGIPLLAIIIFVMFKLVMPLFKLFQKRVDKLTLVTRESINGVRVIRAFGQGDREVNRFAKTNDDLADVGYRAGRIMSTLNPSINLIFNLVVLTVVFFAFRMVIDGQITDYVGLGNVSALIQYAFQMLFSILMLTFTFIMYPRAEVSGKRIQEILDLETSIHDTGNDEFNDYSFKGKVEYKNVCFKFPDADKNVLTDINFKAEPGETIAIIGSTGSGKSTVVNLLPRFFDISQGELKIDNVLIKDIKLNKLRSLIGFVPQTASLFSGTIKSNIAYGADYADDEEIKKAAEIAQAEEFINELDDGYDAVVDQGGSNFSGGQKQRLSIARAIVRRPKIFVFDDSFSALDFKTDSVLRKALRDQVNDATVFIVAQRIGTIMDADKIIVLQEGKMVGIGKHKELLETCEVYKEIALSQLDEEEIR
ncbi:MAG: ABC transporter ATP-binding protein [Tenericutes bacterium]|jgi:ATP-binding cassette subfamily B multidrug efflux pump|nr:ABC transporter ATP-binding protein [Mycoplasmatota bacterium]